MDNQDSDHGRPARVVLPLVLTAVMSIAALAIGMIIGAAVTWFWKADGTPVTAELATADLHGACAPLLSEMTLNLNHAGDNVADLVTQVKEKEAKVHELEAEMATRSARGAQIRDELTAAKAELATMKTQLETAIQEREALVVELKKTVAELDEQKEETHVAKEESLANEWTAFVNQAQLDVCEKGNRKRLGKCREAVQSALVAQQEEFARCVRAGQEAPSLHEAAKHDDLPAYSTYLNENDRIVQGWFVRMCDPTLPEAKTFAGNP